MNYLLSQELSYDLKLQFKYTKTPQIKPHHCLDKRTYLAIKFIRMTQSTLARRTFATPADCIMNEGSLLLLKSGSQSDPEVVGSGGNPCVLCTRRPVAIHPSVDRCVYLGGLMDG